MPAVDVIGWTITALLVGGGLLRALTVWLNDHAFFGRLRLGHRARYVLVAAAIAVAAIGVLGSILLLPLRGLGDPRCLYSR